VLCVAHNCTQTVVVERLGLTLAIAQCKLVIICCNITSCCNTLQYYCDKQVCPTGFVVPEDATHDGVEWITGSGCAAACPRPMFTHNEYNAVSSHS
jgi:hypothetical protein